MQLNSNTLSSENPNLSIIMDPHRSRGTKFSKQLKCEHMVFIVFSIVIIALLGIILQKVDKECEISVTQIGKKSKSLFTIIPTGCFTLKWWKLNGSEGW